VVNVGLQAARKVGTGLPLVNALVGIFKGVARSILGAAAGILGQGIRAAAAWQQGGPDHVVDIDSLPLAPKGFFGPEEVDRIVGVYDQPGKNTTTGAEVYHQNRANWPEDWSKSAIEDVVDAVEHDNSDKYQEDAWQIDDQQRRHMIWIGKRF
jgi:hypothetical protein